MCFLAVIVSRSLSFCFLISLISCRTRHCSQPYILFRYTAFVSPYIHYVHNEWMGVSFFLFSFSFFLFRSCCIQGKHGWRRSGRFIVTFRLENKQVIARFGFARVLFEDFADQWTTVFVPLVLVLLVHVVVGSLLHVDVQFEPNLA